ncbi:cysteine desulfuration protein SufE [bacterium BMS3Bbin04]|nr:cysteine desulfuration protein SufE [bacterium BMS3Bbin04]
MADFLIELAEDIELIPDRREVLELMVSLGKELDPLPPEERTDDNRVAGCVSNVHVRARLDDEGKVKFRGSSEAFITSGYVRALFTQFDGWNPEEFLAEAEPIVSNFLARTNLAESVLPTRANAIGNILLTMKQQVTRLIKT